MIPSDFYIKSKLECINNIFEDANHINNTNIYGIDNTNYQIYHGQISYVYKTKVQDNNIRLLEDGIYRFYIPQTEINKDLNLGELVFNSVSQIYNLTTNTHYPILKVQEKYIDFYIENDTILNFYNTTTIENQVHDIIFNFEYIQQKYKLYQDKRNRFNNIVYVDQQCNRENLLQTISNQQIDWTKWGNWKSQNYWNYDSHNTYISDTGNYIYQGSPRTGSGSKLYISDKYPLHYGQSYTFSINVLSVSYIGNQYFLFKVVDLSDGVEITDINTTSDLYIKHEFVTNDWNRLSFTFTNNKSDYSDKLTDIEISLEIINCRDELLNFCNPQLEQGNIPTNFINGEVNIERPFIYSNLYISSLQYNQELIDLGKINIIVMIDELQLSVRNSKIKKYTHINKLIYDTQTNQIKHYVRFIDEEHFELVQSFNFIFGYTQYNYSIKLSDGSLFNINVSIDDGDIEESNFSTNSTISDIFNDYYKNKFELLFQVNCMDEIENDQYSPYTGNVQFTSIKNILDGKLLENSNNDIPSVVVNSKYDGKTIIS